jgi:hypothetical protein
MTAVSNIFSSFESLSRHRDGFENTPHSQFSSKDFGKFIAIYKENLPEVINNINQLERADIEKLISLNKQVKRLSRRIAEHQRTSWLGTIEKIVSSLHNFWRFGLFMSLADMGVMLAKQLKPILVNQMQVDNSVESDEESSVELFTAEQPTDDDEQSVASLSDLPDEAFYTDDSTTEDDEEDFEQLSGHDHLEGATELDYIEEEERESLPIDKMMETLINVWQHANKMTKTYLTSIFQVILKDATLLAWEPIGDRNDYCLTLANELSGNNHPCVGIWIENRCFRKIPGSAILKHEIKFKFCEEGNDLDGYRQEIQITNGGLVQRFGGWKPDVEVTKLVIECKEDERQPTVSMGAGKYGMTTIEKRFDDAANVLAFLDTFLWQ